MLSGAGCGRIPASAPHVLARGHGQVWQRQARRALRAGARGCEFVLPSALFVFLGCDYVRYRNRGAREENMGLLAAILTPTETDGNAYKYKQPP